MKRKHILVVSQYFYPEPFRINDICQEWVKRGYKVTVVTGIPNYPKGKFYKGYGWTKKRKETWNGVNVIRLPVISRGKSALRLIFNYYSFVISGFFWKLFTKVKADVVFTFEVSPMTQALVSVWYAKRRKIPHYLYVQDLWPENVEIVTGIRSRFILKPIENMVKKIYNNSNLIFATSESFVKEIQKRISENKQKVKYWPQYAEEFYRPSERACVSEIPDDDSFKIIFTGNIGRAQGLEVLCDTAGILKEKNINVKFIIVGDGRYKEQLVAEIKNKNVDDMFILIDRKPAHEIPKYLGACDAAFVSFMNNALFSNTIPAKLQSYMACGVPVIAAATGETEKIIRQAECGVVVEIGNAQALADGIAECAKRTDLLEMGARAKLYSDEHFNKTLLMDEMDKYFNR